MILGKKRRIGRKIEEMSVGEKLKLTEKIEDKDLLLYLGLTNDGNPLYIQHDFASQTAFEKPVVPAIMLIGVVTSAVSKYLPGPGSHVIEQHLSFPKPVFHYATIDFLLEVVQVNKEENQVVIQVEAIDENEDIVISGTVSVVPPKLVERLISEAMENF
ncbi:MaoC/PaaZ C-terminal domain-containing protein [Sporosarcina sp. HYO08]|uniref:MaoC/PaaZ C-terminal domain-containing protein n=1 Tax=Sporosarcina sp. HYO08 TaxID=1759557 RepID=UPI00079C0B2E|nr:MaoC/PaaZ C-terminal domain-containing protein [Sporosarcina sp. HYO08]KXH87200.1 enoyl-CoA hydratase [Sporosarcina sp. HYO08]